jgi:hypothetical protein
VLAEKRTRGGVQKQQRRRLQPALAMHRPVKRALDVQRPGAKTETSIRVHAAPFTRLAPIQTKPVWPPHHLPMRTGPLLLSCFGRRPAPRSKKPLKPRRCRITLHALVGLQERFEHSRSMGVPGRVSFHRSHARARRDVEQPHGRPGPEAIVQDCRR